MQLLIIWRAWLVINVSYSSYRGQPRPKTNVKKYLISAGRILCRQLKYVTGYCKSQSGLAATIH
jgi:hypothetical protein